MDSYSLPALAARVRGKTKQEFLRAPLVNHWSEHRYRAQLGRHAENLPWLTRDNFDLVTELRNEGIAVRDASTIIPPDAMAVADRFVDRLRKSTTQKHCVDALPDDLVIDPVLYKWGLNDDNLDLAENFIGLPVHYRGVGVKRERPDGVAADARQWHIDPEDRRILKIIVYLSEVHDGCGPFEYVSREATNHAVQALRYRSGYVSDAALARLVPTTDWIKVTGHRLSAIFVATASLFHRAKPPTTIDRYSMTFSYSSWTPFQTRPEFMVSAAALASLRGQLTLRQRRAVMAD
jgi:hypothetical protein